jgi:hypothetical protein
MHAYLSLAPAPVEEECPKWGQTITPPEHALNAGVL